MALSSSNLVFLRTLVAIWLNEILVFMKIGIITQPLQNNYGGLLQNYALQRVLEKMGHEVVTIDQEYSRIPLWRILASTIKTLLLRVVGKNREFFFLPKDRELKYINQNTLYFLDNYINHTEKISNEKQIRRIVKSLFLEAYIVGSDQVWRPCYNNNIYISFLKFADSYQVKRIAYAASFGVDNWEFSKMETKKCKKLIKSFDAVSVRESSGIELCRRYLDVDACQVLDPTMLLDKCDYIDLVEKENEGKSIGSLLSYILDPERSKIDLIENVAERLNLIPFSVMPELQLNSKTIVDIDKCVFPSVTKWLRGFMDAEFVVCDSFHGAVFSIIFNKEFVILGNEERGMARFHSLLKMYGLEERLVTDLNDFSVVMKSIDWSRVNRIRKERNCFSFEFLSRSLDN